MLYKKPYLIFLYNKLYLKLALKSMLIIQSFSFLSFFFFFLFLFF